ncbi:MAG: hypothetical protein WC233_04475 [Sphaerochaeta sp.]
MQRPSSMMLSLVQPIFYQDPPFELQGDEESYKKAIAYLDGEESGTEIVFAFASTGRLLFVGAKPSPSKAELQAIEEATEQPQTAFSNQLEAGRYEFMQLALPESLSMVLSMLPITIDGPARIYLRLLKEGPLAIIAQLWIAR